MRASSCTIINSVVNVGGKCHTQFLSSQPCCNHHPPHRLAGFRVGAQTL